MMGIHHHQPMVVCIAEKELGQALVSMIITETNRKGITSLGILMFIFITTVLLTIKENHGIEKLVVLVDIIIMCLLSVGEECSQ